MNKYYLITATLASLQLSSFAHTPLVYAAPLHTKNNNIATSSVDVSLPTQVGKAKISRTEIAQAVSETIKGFQSQNSLSSNYNFKDIKNTGESFTVAQVSSSDDTKTSTGTKKLISLDNKPDDIPNLESSNSNSNSNSNINNNTTNEEKLSNFNAKSGNQKNKNINSKTKNTKTDIGTAEIKQNDIESPQPLVVGAKGKILNAGDNPISNATTNQVNAEYVDINPQTLDPKKPKFREIFQVIINNTFEINGLVLVFENNNILIEKRHIAPILKDLKDPKFVTISNKEYFFIPSKFVSKLNEESLRLEVSLSPEYFHEQVITLDKQEFENAKPITALYVNYNLSTNFDEFKNITGSFAGGFSHKDNWLLKSDFNMDADKKFTRGDTSFIYEFPNKNKIVIGDTFGNTINNFSSANFFGLKLSSPYYANSVDNKNLIPSVNVEGFSVNPSKLDIYINDKLYQSKDVAAGKYNLSVPLLNESGLGNVRAVVYDKAGNPVILEFPFFSDSNILKEGTFEYDISGGFVRKADNGFFSYSYNDPIINGLFTFGINNRWTQNLFVQATKDYQAVSGTANFIPFIGLGKVGTSLSVNNSGESLGQIQYSQSFDHFSYGVNYTGALSGNRFCTAYSSNCVKDSLQLYTGFKLPLSLGNLNFTYTKNNSLSKMVTDSSWIPQNTEVASLGYSKNILNGVSLNANISKTKGSQLGDRKGLSAYVGLNFALGNRVSSSSSISNDGTRNNYQQQVSFNENPDKPWLGYGGITANKSQDGSLGSNFFYAANLNNFSYQLNGSHSKEGGFNGGGNVSGSVYYLPEKNKIGLAKEITTGLALVEVENANGTPIPISYENKLSGFTDKDGVFVVPNISPHNVETIAVDINKMPYNISLMEHRKSYKVPSNGTARVVFKAKTNPFLVRLYGLPSGYVFKLGEDYYAVGEQGKTTLESEGNAKIEYSAGKYCEITFNKDIKSYFCNEDGTEMNFIREAYAKSSMKEDRKQDAIQKEYIKLMKALGKTPKESEIKPIIETNSKPSISDEVQSDY